MTYTCTEPHLIPNKPQTITERDDNGCLIGIYTGYYDYKHFEVRMYPQMKHKFVTWRGRPQKKVINAMYVRCTPAKEKKTITAKSQTSEGIRGLKDLPGQTKFKF